MKLNLPSTWTHQKSTALFLLSFLSVNQVNAGQAFKNCLVYEYNNATIYNLLLNYPLSSNSNITSSGIGLCCGNDNCTPCSYVSSNVVCYKVNSLIFCGTFSPLLLCQGIIGDSSITTNTTLGGKCSGDSLASASNYLNALPTSSFQGFEQGYARCKCSSESFCTACNWDNGGWTCSWFSPFSADISSPCFLQWPAPWPGPADKNPYPLPVVISSSSSSSATNSIAISSIVSSLSSNSPTLTPSPEPNPHLTEKIAIPIGTTVGVSSGAGLVYYFWKKRKRKQQLANIATDTQTEEKNLPELPTGISYEISNNQTIEVNQQPTELLAFRDPAVQADSSTTNTQPQTAQQVINPNQPRQITFTIPAWLNRIIS